MELRQALIENQIASLAQIDEALARQELYGGDIITNLLELTPVDEGAAQGALARFYGLQSAPTGELPYASAAAIELVPRELATSLDVYPFRFESGVLSVVTAQPLSDGARIELGFSLKVELLGLLALAPRVKQAIARDYAFALDRRTRKAVSRLERRAESPPSQAPNPMSQGPRLSDFPRPHSVVPLSFPMAWAESLTPTGGQLLAETAEQPEVMSRQQLDAQRPDSVQRTQGADLATASSAGDNAPARRRGPYTTAQAKRDLRETTTPQQVLAVYFDYAAQYFDHAAAFTLKGKEARIRLTRGLANAKTSGRIQLGTSPALSRISQSRQWASTRLRDEDPRLAEILGTSGVTQAILLPVRVKDRCTVILYGGFVNSNVGLADVGELLAFEALVAHALEHSIRVRKTIHPNPPTALPSAPPAARYTRPSVEEQAHAIANLLGGSTPPSDVQSLPPARGAAQPPAFSPPVIRETNSPAPALQATAGMTLTGTGKTLVSLTKQSDQSLKSTNPPNTSAFSAKPPPLTSQPPGVYDEELDEARDSGWDFDR